MNSVLIWSGQWRAYWRPEGKGYTENRSEAGRYSPEEAGDILRSVGPEKKLKIKPVPEKPLLFKGEMVRATLANRKTQTRRVITDILGMGRVTEFQRSTTPGYDWTFRGRSSCWNDLRHDELLERCPYGQVGDRLYGRETFLHQVDSWQDITDEWESSWGRKGCRIEYVADGAVERHLYPSMMNSPYMRKRPSIHMPRWASRILLEIVSVSVEPLQAISEEDAIAEGAHWLDCGKDRWGQPQNGWSMLDPHPADHARCLGSARFAFASYVNYLHGGPNWNLKPSTLWDENPWVWAVEFKRVGMQS